MAKGKKLPYKAANYLLVNILNAITIEGSDASEEIRPDTHPDSQVDSEDLSMSQTLARAGLGEQEDGSTEGASGSSIDTSKAKNGVENKPDRESKSNESDNSDESEKKTKALCRFYNNGKCKYNADCRFLHPKICPKFRQHGDSKIKGCQGGCDFLHPNVCRTSLKDRMCTYPAYHGCPTVGPIRGF